MAVSEKFDALVPTSMDSLMVFAEKVAKSSLIPREYQNKPSDCLIAMSMGMEIGLKPVQALQSIAVINGRPSLWGTAARALIMASGQVQSLFETEPGEVRKTKRARCEITRKGFADPFVGEFAEDDARRAGLAGKDNYQKYPAEMYGWRAFHMAARKAFPDIYKGLAAAEEIQDAAPFENGNGKQTITLALDAPAEPSEQPAMPTGHRRARAPKSQEPQAPPPEIPSAATSSAEVAPCGFCHQPGHTFNDCPQNRIIGADADSPIAKEFPEAPALATDADRKALMKAARDLMGQADAKGWVSGRLKSLGVSRETLTMEQVKTLSAELDELKASMPPAEDF